MQLLYKTTFLLFFVSIFCFGQNLTKPKVHSHNDYLREKPFIEAYRSGAVSIEADIILKSGILYVAHEAKSIELHRTIESLYFETIKKEFADFKDKRRDVQLLIDIKNNPYETLVLLEQTIKEYSSILRKNDRKGVTVVISGKRPEIKDYINYPDYITFDYQSTEEIPEASLNKVALISLNFRHYSNWKGNEPMNEGDSRKVKEIISKAHSFGKPFRFWGTPDSETAWKLFNELGVDFINTDSPGKVVQFFKGQ